VRVAAAYYWTPADAAFLRDAVLFVARHGWRLLPAYTFYADTGEWRHRDIGPRAPFRKWLSDVSYRGGRLAFGETPSSAGAAARDGETPSYDEALAAAHRLAEAALEARSARLVH